MEAWSHRYSDGHPSCVFLGVYCISDWDGGVWTAGVEACHGGLQQVQVSLSICCKHAEVCWSCMGVQERCDLVSRTIYEKLASAFTEESAILYRQRVDEISPNIRYCAYNIGESCCLCHAHVPLTHMDSEERMVATLEIMEAVLEVGAAQVHLCIMKCLSSLEFRGPKRHQRLDADETDRWRRWDDGWETGGEYVTYTHWTRPRSCLLALILICSRTAWMTRLSCRFLRRLEVCVDVFVPLF